MQRKWVALIAAGAVCVLIVAACGPRQGEPTAAPTPGGGSQIANPASAYCVENGYVSRIRTAPDGSQYGVCISPDGNECEEWAFFRGECGPGAKPTPTAATQRVSVAEIGLSFALPAGSAAATTGPGSQQGIAGRIWALSGASCNQARNQSPSCRLTG